MCKSKFAILGILFIFYKNSKNKNRVGKKEKKKRQGNTCIHKEEQGNGEAK
jgi:hypothetical protein